MPLITSTAEEHRASDAVRLIVVKDAWTLLFVFSSVTAAFDTKAASLGDEGNGLSSGRLPFQSALFTFSSAFNETLRTSSPDEERLALCSESEIAKQVMTLQEYFWFHATSPDFPRSNPTSSANASMPSATLCCPCCRQKIDSSGEGDHAYETLPDALLSTRSPASPPADSSFAELRATAYLSTAAEPVASNHSVTYISRLHIVRQCGEDGFFDVWCTFVCGCGTLATFALSREGNVVRGVHLQVCVWVPQIIRAWDGSTLAPSYATKTMNRVGGTSYQIEAAPTAFVRPLLQTRDTSASARGSEMIILTPYRAFDSAAPKLHYVSLRCLEQPVDDASTSAFGVSNTVHNATHSATEWRLYGQGWFEMSDILCVPPSFMGEVEGKRAVAEQRRACEGVDIENVGQPNVLRHSAGLSLRSVRWLPGTVDLAHGFPLLALLYAAPAVSIGDPCLDTLSVCCLREDESNKRDCHHSTLEVSKARLDVKSTPCKRVSGRVSLGPWSVRAGTLAHPSFLFATTLAPVLVQPTLNLTDEVKLSNLHVMEEKTERKPRTAAAAFRTARRVAAYARTEVLGVFQRPAQEPYAASRLFRAARRSTAKSSGRDQTGVDGAAQRAQWDQKGHERAFAFVLFSADGEEARCALDGYVECADTVTSFRDGRLKSDVLTAGGGYQTVAQVCALLTAPVREEDEEGGGGAVDRYTLVVLTVLAQPLRGGVASSVGNAGSAALSFEATVNRSRSGWRFLVQLTHRIPVNAVGYPLSSSTPTFPIRCPSSSLSSLITVDTILCWDVYIGRAEMQRSTSGGNASLIVRGYAARTKGSACILQEGIFVLSEVQLISPGEKQSGASGAAATPGVNPSSSENQHDSNNNSSFVRQVCAVELAHAFMICSSVDSTPLDLLSHTPPGFITVYELQPSWRSAALPSDMLPVALGWVDKILAPARVSSLDAITTVSTAEAELARCVAQLDVVAVLRCGVIVGWCVNPEKKVSAREKDKKGGSETCPHVRQLGMLRCSTRPNTSASQNNATEFLQRLLNVGAGPADVRMEVVVSSNKDGQSTLVLVVIATGPFVGVVRLRDGYVEHVLDMRAANPLAWTAGPNTESSLFSFNSASIGVTVAQFQRLPPVTPYSVARYNNGGGEGVGIAFSFAWTGVLSLYECAEKTVNQTTAVSTAASMHGTKERSGEKNAFALEKGMITATCVIQLAVISWADVAASQTWGPYAEDAVFQRALKLSVTVPVTAVTRDELVAGNQNGSLSVGVGSPPPIVFLRVSTSWCDQGGLAESSEVLRLSPLSRMQCPSISWIGAVERRNVQTEGGRGSKVIAPPNEAALLCVCNSVLLQVLWEGKQPLTDVADTLKHAEKSGNAGSGDDESSLSAVRFLRWSHGTNVVAAPLQDETKTPAAAEAVVRHLILSPLRVSTVLEAVRNGVAVTIKAGRLSALPTASQRIAEGQPVSAEPRNGIQNAGWTCCTLRQILYITPLMGASTLPSAASVSHPSLSPPPDVEKSFHSLTLCTVVIVEDNRPEPASGTPVKDANERDHVVSFLVCGVPLPSSNLRSSLASRATTDAGGRPEEDALFGSFAWHWIPLPAVDMRDFLGSNNASCSTIGVTCALPLNLSMNGSSPLSTSDAYTNQTACQSCETQMGSVWEFYCEGVAAAFDSSTNCAPSFVQGLLVIRYDRLLAALESGVGGEVCPSQNKKSRVFAYSVVDPTLVYWRNLSDARGL